MLENACRLLVLASATIVLALPPQAVAQTTPAAAPSDPLFAGLPEYQSQETGVPFYSKHYADDLDNYIRAKRAAAAACDRAAYDKIHRPIRVVQPDPAVSPAVHAARAGRDTANYDRTAADLTPPFPASCLPPTAATPPAQIGPGAAQAGAAANQDGLAGVPEYVSAETGIRFFWKANADSLDAWVRRKRAAAAKCDRQAYDQVLQAMLFPATSNQPDILAERVQRERASFARGKAEFTPPFPQPCVPLLSSSTPFSIFLIGGITAPTNTSSSVTGVDTFFGPGNFLIDTKAGAGGGAVTPLLGARGRWGTIPSGDSKEPLDRLSFFAEAGIQTGFGAQSFMQPFQRVSGFPQGFGSNAVTENFQIPIVAGIQIPIVQLAPTTPPVTLDLYGGITLDSWNHTLQGGEAGPGGRGFFNQNNRFTVDPTVGFGVNFPLGVPGLMVGFNGEVLFRPGSVVTVPSNGFPSETYYGTIAPQTNLLFMARFGYRFGAR